MKRLAVIVALVCGIVVAVNCNAHCGHCGEEECNMQHENANKTCCEYCGKADCDGRCMTDKNCAKKCQTRDPDDEMQEQDKDQMKDTDEMQEQDKDQMKDTDDM